MCFKICMDRSSPTTDLVHKAKITNYKRRDLTASILRSSSSKKSISVYGMWVLLLILWKWSVLWFQLENISWNIRKYSAWRALADNFWEVIQKALCISTIMLQWLEVSLALFHELNFFAQVGSCSELKPHSNPARNNFVSYTV